MARTIDMDGSERFYFYAMKPFEKESIKRQYSGKNYTIEDKKNVINYYKKRKVWCNG